MGSGYDGDISTTEVIDLEENGNKTCSDLAQVQYPMYGAVGQVMPNGLQALICGGYAYARASNQCILLDKDKARSFSKLSTPRGNAAAAESEHGLLITGGMDHERHGLSSVEVISTEDGNSSILSSKMPDKMWLHTITKINEFRDIFIVIGGYRDGEGTSNATHIFDQFNIFRMGPYLQTARRGHSTGIITDKITNEDFVVTCGGYDPYTSTCEYLSANELTEWKYAPDLPHGRLWGQSSLTIDGELYVIGGNVFDEWQYDGRIHKLSLMDGSFSWALLPQRLKTPRVYFVALAVPEEMVTCENELN